MTTIIQYILIAITGGFALLAFSFLLFMAIDKEVKFNENIREARCQKSYIAGYCEGYEMAGVQ